MVKIVESSLNISDITKKPKHDVNKVAKLGEQGASIQFLLSLPCFSGIITLISVPIAIDLNHVNLPQFPRLNQFF